MIRREIDQQIVKRGRITNPKTGKPYRYFLAEEPGGFFETGEAYASAYVHPVGSDELKAFFVGEVLAYSQDAFEGFLPMIEEDRRRYFPEADRGDWVGAPVLIVEGSKLGNVVKALWEAHELVRPGEKDYYGGVPEWHPYEGDYGTSPWNAIFR
jgi:hypothetical protein